MNKQQFLDKLKSYLDILSENEVKDILDEYADVIDQKVQEGMSEEDAVRDFGNIDELGREILEAYKINTNRKKSSTTDTAARIGVVLNEVVDNLAKLFSTVFKDLTMEGVSRVLVLVIIAIILLFVLQIPFFIVSNLIGSFLTVILPYGIGFVIAKVLSFLSSLLFVVIAILMVISFVRVGMNGEEINTQNLFRRPLTEGFKFEEKKKPDQKENKAENKEKFVNEPNEFHKKEENIASMKQAGSRFGKGIINCFVWVLRVTGVCILLPFWVTLIFLGIVIGIFGYLTFIGIPLAGIILILGGIFVLFYSGISGLTYLIFNKSHRFTPVGVWLVVATIAIGIGIPLTIHEFTSLEPIYVGTESASDYVGNKKEIIEVIPYDEEYIFDFGNAKIAEFVIDDTLQDTIVLEGIGSKYLGAHYSKEDNEIEIIIHQHIDDYSKGREYIQFLLKSIKDKKILILDDNKIEIVVRVPKNKIEVFKYYDKNYSVQDLKNNYDFQ